MEFLQDSDIKLNKVYCMDCLEYLKLVPDNCVDLVVCDPPYYKIVKDSWDSQWKDEKEYCYWCLSWIKEIERVSKTSGSFYLWGGIGKHGQHPLIKTLLLIEKYTGLIFKDWVTWKKKRGIGMRRGWLYTREEVLWFTKDEKLFIWNVDKQYSEEPNLFKKGFSGYECKSAFKRIANVWSDIPEILGNKKIKHYTPKPLSAIERIINVHTKEEDIVLDLFMGSGTTAIASINLKRKFMGCEINQEYVDIANKRIEEIEV